MDGLMFIYAINKSLGFIHLPQSLNISITSTEGMTSRVPLSSTNTFFFFDVGVLELEEAKKVFIFAEVFGDFRLDGVAVCLLTWVCCGIILFLAELNGVKKLNIFALGFDKPVLALSSTGATFSVVIFASIVFDELESGTIEA